MPDASTSASDASEFGQASLAPFGLPPSANALYALSGEPVSGYAAIPYQPGSAASSGLGIGGLGGGGSATSIAQLQQLAAAPSNGRQPEPPASDFAGYR